MDGPTRLLHEIARAGDGGLPVTAVRHLDGVRLSDMVALIRQHRVVRLDDRLVLSFSGQLTLRSALSKAARLN